MNEPFRFDAGKGLVVVSAFLEGPKGSAAIRMALELKVDSRHGEISLT